MFFPFKKYSSALLIIFSLVGGPLSAAEKEKTPLAKQMTEMGKAMRTLKEQVEDPAKKDSSLELVANMEKDALESKSLVPALASKLPEAEREKFATAYKAKIDELLAEYKKLAEAIRAGKIDDAKARINAVFALKRKGHEQFTEADEEEK